MQYKRTMRFVRSSGIILHPTSLPGPYGIGDLGPEAIKWVDFLADAGCSLWQVLPLGPTGYGDSPYQCFSAFAGNPFLVSPELLLEEGLLEEGDLADLPRFPQERVDFGWVINWKLELLDRAYDHFQRPEAIANTLGLRISLIDFQVAQAGWLEDFALFMALKEAHGGAPWHTWEPELRDRDAAALEHARQEHAHAIRRQIFRQFLFFRQWEAVRDYAHEHDVQIIGDIPIFVAHDSADVWAHPELFYLADGKPTVVAGVPPDYFSATGQLWGNPLYKWDVHKADGYTWWLNRIKAVLSMVDLVRLDHFRGFAAYWEVPGDAETAIKGRWVKGPGKAFLEVVQEKLHASLDASQLPIIAEDLGVITPDVEALRDQFHLPGMKVLQFAFAAGTGSDPFLPHQYTQNCVVYTGTHDNDTVLGWYERVDEDERSFYRRYLNRSGDDASWDLLRAAWSSVAVFALAPIQDFLRLGNEARMNYPGNPSGNWTWRMPTGALNPDLIKRVKEINYLYSRAHKIEEPPVKKDKVIPSGRATSLEEN